MKKTLAYIVLIILVGGLLFLGGILFNNFIGLSIFYKRGVSIEKLNHRELKFKELPFRIQDVLRNPSEFKENIQGFESLDLKSLIVIDSNKKYEKEVVETGPWIDYILLKDLSTGEKYRIPIESSEPYIIYKNKLYISKAYNVININSEAIYTALYDEYTLK